MAVTIFDKPADKVDGHIKTLRERGLTIPDESRASHYLANISYFRLSAYTRPFYTPNVPEHQFLAGADFETVLNLYVFDRELRLLLLDAIERIEVALRAQLTNTLAEHYGPHGYLDPTVFDDRYDHDWLLRTLEQETRGRNVEVFMEHYRTKYTASPTHPPIWMALELLTFKSVSFLFSNLRDEEDTRRISNHFGWPHAVLKSWFRSISDLRNLCAHHARVWNREFGSFPMIPRRRSGNWPQIPERLEVGNIRHPKQAITPQRRLYMQLVVIESLMRVACPESNWATRLLELLDRYPQVSRLHMGMPDDWDSDPFWRL